jgi:hypothetical protein
MLKLQLLGKAGVSLSGWFKRYSLADDWGYVGLFEVSAGQSF